MRYFALFVDVMGVQNAFRPGTPLPDKRADGDDRDKLVAFRKDLTTSVSAFDLLSLATPNLPQPTFVAAFSDCAFVVATRFATVAHAAIWLMQLAIRHQYPLRGGVGVGSFEHAESGVRTPSDGPLWSISSFVGSSIVGAHAAEQCDEKGLRVFLHPTVLECTEEPLLEDFSIPTGGGSTSARELRIWNHQEALQASAYVRAMRALPSVPPKAIPHYDETIEAYRRFADDTRPLLPHGPNLWL